jgi:hypothetical protein
VRALTAAGLAVLLIAAGGRELGADRADFVGSAACGSCHEREFAIWARTPHARAYESLGEEHRADASCRACHTTGDAPAGPAYFRGVGCEACHGAGAAYAPADIMRNAHLARALGLFDLSTPDARRAVCQGCHVASTRIAPFEAELAWERIAH